MWIFRTSTSRLALVSSRRGLDASERSRRNPNPKTRMLGLAPSIFFRGSTSRKRRTGVFGDPQNIYVCRVGAKDDKEKIVCVTLLSDLKKTKKRATEIKESRCHLGERPIKNEAPLLH